MNLLTNLLAQKITVNFYNFVEYLKYMGQGMLIIFLIIGLIIVATIVINMLFSRKKNDKS